MARKKALDKIQVPDFNGIRFGSPTWTRTRDLRINSPSLYQLSYQGTAF